MSVRKFVLPGVAVAALVASGAGVATATVKDFTATTTAGTVGTAKAGAAAGGGAQAGTATGSITYLAASLLGRNEVPAADAEATGDQDGRAQALLRIQGER